MVLNLDHHEAYSSVCSLLDIPIDFCETNNFQLRVPNHHIQVWDIWAPANAPVFETDPLVDNQRDWKENVNENHQANKYFKGPWRPHAVHWAALKVIVYVSYLCSFWNLISSYNSAFIVMDKSERTPHERPKMAILACTSRDVARGLSFTVFKQW